MPSRDPRVSYPSLCPTKPTNVPTSLRPSGWTTHGLCLAPRAGTGAKCARQFTRAAARLSGRRSRFVLLPTFASQDLQIAMWRWYRPLTIPCRPSLSSLALRVQNLLCMIATRSPPLRLGRAHEPDQSHGFSASAPVQSADAGGVGRLVAIIRSCQIRSHSADAGWPRGWATRMPRRPDRPGPSSISRPIVCGCATFRRKDEQ